MRLEGKVAVVTGEGQNTGRAIALAMAREGASVVVNVKSNQAEADAVAREVEQLHGTALVALADVGDELQVQRMFDAVAKTFGRVDILVSNTAHRVHQPFLELTLAEWERTISVILRGAFLCTRASLPLMIKAGGGRIIYMAGDGAFKGSRAAGHVSAAKMGLVGLARSLASDYAAQNITVNVISPGKLRTVRHSNAYEHGEAPDDVRDVPLGRSGEPGEVADMCIALASSAGSYVTGQTFHVNGGWGYF
jgi:3-oxoacyl-[acyl-carrier protein] reductase